MGTTSAVCWVRADATRAPLCPAEPATVIMNPPFGAQAANEHADRAFLETASRISAVSYSIHNTDSEPFVRAFADDNAGDVTHAYAATVELPRQFDFHTAAGEPLDVEIFRIEWAR